MLDNCEHVVAGGLHWSLAAAGVSPLHMLATSREPLRVPGEVE